MSDEIVGVSKGKTERALADWPYTVFEPDRGSALIAGEHVTPGRAHGFMLLAATFFFVGILAAIIIGGSYGSWGVFFLVGIIVFALTGVIEFGGPAVFSRKFAIRIYPDRIEMRRRSYSLDEDVEFRIERHRRANQEAHTEHFTGKRQPWVYRRAFEVVMQYGERRIVLAEMREKDQDKARALVIRLQNWCDDFEGMRARFMKRQAKAASGQPVPEPAKTDEFGPAPPIR
jgi:hypothetical protein